LVGSIIENYNCGFKLIQPQAKDRRYQKGIIVRDTSEISAYDELIAYLMKKDGINGISLLAFEKYLKNKGLINKVIPRELYNSEYIYYKNESFWIQSLIKIPLLY
jgi:hypothetical protein